MAEGRYLPVRLYTPYRPLDVKMRYLGTLRVLAVLCGQIVCNPVCLQTVNPWLLDQRSCREDVWSRSGLCYRPRVWGRPSWILCT